MPCVHAIAVDADHGNEDEDETLDEVAAVSHRSWSLLGLERVAPTKH